MSKNTTNLKLYKKEPDIDLKDKFDVKTMLNDNWDKIDENVAQTDQRILVNENARHVHGNESILDTINQEDINSWNSKAKKVTFTITIPSTSWTDEGTKGFSKVVVVPGILETDNPSAVLIVDGLTIDAKENLRAELAKVADGITSNGSIKFYAKAVPTIDIPLFLEVVR